MSVLQLPTKPQSEELWPAQVSLILSAMEAVCPPEHDRRRTKRLAYHVRAELRLFADPPDADSRTLYTRDVDPRGLGFITPHRLPLGYGGWLSLLIPSGRKVSIDCIVYRCREVIPGWYEGALHFNREQWMFAENDE